jgi:hypothetical protein
LKRGTVFGAEDGAEVAAELVDAVAAEVGDAAEGELLVGGNVVARIETPAPSSRARDRRRPLR